jgi:hypothetical protein
VWHDSRLDGLTAAEIASDLLQFIRLKSSLNKTVAAARPNDSWVQDISRILSIPAIAQFIDLWEKVHALSPLNSESGG